MTTVAANLNTELLCESCGYPILSLPDNGVCPECGRSRALSMPHTRQGTVWQNRPSLRNWVVNAKNIVVGPRRFFDSLRIDGRHGRLLLVINLSIAAALLAHPLVGVFRFDPARGVHDLLTVRGFLTVVTSAGVLWVAAIVFFCMLTFIEFIGIRFFAARRQWRLLPAAALQICAHSSYAWIAASLLLVVGLSMSSQLPQFGANRVAISFWDEVVEGAKFIVPALPPLMGFLAGLMWFEWFVYLGVRSCKFANAFPGDATLASQRTKN